MTHREANMRKDRQQTTDNRLQTAKHGTQKNNLCSVFCVLYSEKGMVLIVSLLLLLVATVVGITALSTSTTKVMIAGNQRLSEINFSYADSGVSVSSPILTDTAFNGAVGASYTGLVIAGSNFLNEVTGALPRDPDCAVLSTTCGIAAPDIRYTIGATTVSVDVDYLYTTYTTGSAIEFASGYEGLGKGAGSGGSQTNYSINSYGVDSAASGSVTGIGALYRYVP
jgi:Tfp pilus assembly protein PilX